MCVCVRALARLCMSVSVCVCNQFHFTGNLICVVVQGEAGHRRGCACSRGCAGSTATEPCFPVLCVEPLAAPVSEMSPL